MKKIFAVLLIALSLHTQIAFADVLTVEKTDGYTDYIYVAGSQDNYPIEYYDNDSKTYMGIIPDLLNEISKESGLNFVYINGDKNKLAENLQVEIVTSADGNVSFPDTKDYVKLISYEDNGKTIECGLVFTQISQDHDAEKIKVAVNKITSDRRNGIYLSYATTENKSNYLWIIVAVLCFLLLCIATALLMHRIKKIKKDNETDKMTDAETGMGNLLFFKYHFKYTIGDISRNLYYLAYIILDSSYLRSYHGDNSFEDVLKHTSAVLSEYTGDREISARITENGFALAFQSTNYEDAKLRIEEIMNKLNSFEDVKEKSNKLVFHCAIYNLSASDRNCEILLFNLRKNCNSIFGTEKQIIYCDTHSMNVIQEEKKITESILNGFENNEFKMYLQFVVDNTTKRIVSAEGLSRWDSINKGLLSPSKYISNMEISGLITKHDFYMFELVCRQLEAWSTTEYKNISISCNFTRITLSEKNFIDRIKMISQSYTFDKSRLAIEITEDAIEKDRDAATNNVKLCKELGFKIYLDDLGSGYTSLANLCDYPIDVVKIDREILLKTNKQRGKELFNGIIALAHSLNIKVICEGVETAEQNQMVSASACDFIQGWYYSKALPQEEYENFINSFNQKYIS